MADQVKVPEQNQAGFKKEIGLFSGVNILVGIIIGSGVFYLGSFILLNVQMSMGYALLAWAIGGIISLLGGLCFAELGAMNPKAGGMYVYMSEAYHPVVGFSNEWTSIFLSGAGSIAAIATAFAMAITRLAALNSTNIRIIAVVSIIVLTAVNLRGVKFGALVQNVFTVAKVLPIVFIILWGLFGGKESPSVNFTAPAGMSFLAVLAMIGTGVVTSMWAYDGWTNLNAVAEEIKNPQKNLPLALIIGLSSITLIYVLFNFAIYRILPFAEIQRLISDGEVYLGIHSAQTLMGRAGFVLIALTMMISMFGSLNGCVMAFPREYYAVSKDGHFIPAFGRLHPKYGTPYVAILCQCAISIILVFLLTLRDLTLLVVFSSIMFKMITLLTVLVYRKKQPNTPRPYKVPLTYVTVIIAALSMLALMVNVLQNYRFISIVGLSVPLSGVLVFFLFFSKKRQVSA